MRVNQGQEFVIGGYTSAGRNFDAIIFGYYDAESRLIYGARTRNGFTHGRSRFLERDFEGAAQRNLRVADYTLGANPATSASY